ncbi:hypothetical protein [Streptomyces sp. NPDC001530]|uniref:hypothetical protein n=1 Tax=Streptomyces sp. NPDC001530 TaxID=3364582 RepID=UPI0036950CB0
MLVPLLATTVAEVMPVAASLSRLKSLAASSAQLSFGAVTGRSWPAVLVVVVSAAVLTVVPVAATAAALARGRRGNR